jgi:transcriptional regulator with XRE-family HTH domain
MRVIEARPQKERAVPASEPRKPKPVLDAGVFGRDLRSLRIRRGYDRAADFTALLRHKYGVEVSDRTLYAIERGEQVPRLDFYLAAVAALEAGPGYFTPAVRADVAERL